MFKNSYLPRISRRFLRTRLRPLVVRHRPQFDPTQDGDVPALEGILPDEDQEEEGSPNRPHLSEHAYRWDTAEPTADQLRMANRFFGKYPATHLWSQPRFRTMDHSEAPEVAFLGRSNVGKSTLLNSLLGVREMAYTSSKPGRTRLLSAFAVNQGKLLLLDMPGYGHASREEWGVEIMKYLKGRKAFRRAFVLVDAQHGPKASDLMLLECLGREGISYQVVLSKIDRYIAKHNTLRDALRDTRHLLESGVGGTSVLGEILGVSSLKKKVGISDLRWSIMVACGLENYGLKS